MDEKNENALETAEGTQPAGLPADGADTLEAEAGLPTENEEEGSPAPDMIFGMRRRTFHLVVVGYALGVIAVSLLGLAGLYPEDSGTMIPGVIGAALGYALAAWLDKRDDAQNAGEPPEN